MFPESFRQAVHSLVNLFQLFYLHDIIKEATLDIFLRDKPGKDNAGLPVKFTRVVNRVEAFAQGAEKICGVCCRRNEFYFNTAVFKVCCKGCSLLFYLFYLTLSTEESCFHTGLNMRGCL